MTTEKDSKEHRIKDAETRRALGGFLLFFGAVLLLAVAFTQTVQGQLLNAACGLLLVAIGAAMVYSGQRVISKGGQEP